MKLFSHRNKYINIKESIQFESLNDTTRVQLYNVFLDEYWNGYSLTDYNGNFNDKGFKFIKNLYNNFYKEPIDEIEPAYLELNKIKETIIHTDYKWYEVFDFLEFILSYNSWQKLEKKISTVLYTNLVGYRLINKLFIPITNELELNTVADAIPESDHVTKAIEALSKKPNPDTHQVSIQCYSAIEEIGDVKLPKGLKQIRDGIMTMRNKESDAHGKNPNKEPINVEEAIMLLITTSAYINYVVSKNKNTQRN